MSDHPQNARSGPRHLNKDLVSGTDDGAIAGWIAGDEVVGVLQGKSDWQTCPSPCIVRDPHAGGGVFREAELLSDLGFNKSSKTACLKWHPHEARGLLFGVEDDNATHVVCWAVLKVLEAALLPSAGLIIAFSAVILTYLLQRTL